MSASDPDLGLWEPSEKMRQVRRVCAEAFGVCEIQMLGKGRRRDLVRARQATAYVLRAVWPQLSYLCIAALMGGRDHSTIIHAVQQIERRMASDADLLGKVSALTTAFGDRLHQRHHDSHVIAWRAFTATAWLVAQHAKAVPIRGEPWVEPDSELAEFADPDKVFCLQCDRAVSTVDAARCESRFCSLRQPEGLAA